MEALATIHLAPSMERLRRCIDALPSLDLSWIRLEMVLLTGALIMAG